jgi:hypothetical protein
MRRLVVTADLSLDGFLGGPAHEPGWGREYDDPELVRYRRRVVSKAGVHATAPEWSLDDIVAAMGDGVAEELAPVVAEAGPELLRELTRRDLVDEFRVTVHPVVFGEGERLFTRSERLLNLSTRFFARGSIAYVLVPVDKYRDRPPPLPWAQGPEEDDDDRES